MQKQRYRDMKQHPPHFCTKGDFMKMGYLLQSDKFQTTFFTQKMMNSHIIYEYLTDWKKKQQQHMNCAHS